MLVEEIFLCFRKVYGNIGSGQFTDQVVFSTSYSCSLIWFFVNMISNHLGIVGNLEVQPFSVADKSRLEQKARRLLWEQHEPKHPD